MVVDERAADVADLGMAIHFDGRGVSKTALVRPHGKTVAGLEP